MDSNLYSSVSTLIMQKTSEKLKEVSHKTEEHEFYDAIPDGYKKGKTKYVIITGSVISGIGKGTFSSSLGNILTLYHGLKVAPVKFDGYLNYDAGTLNPYRHGEVFVLDDGTECDLDLGTYERMLNKNLSRENYLTAGKIFKDIIDKERAGEYLGRDVQFIPHVTGEIKNFLRKLSINTKADVILVEVGGTIGDLENSYFLEAMRELAHEDGKENVCFVNIVYILQPSYIGEQKSKAAQLGLRELMRMGIQPDIVVCRSDNPVTENIREKISIFSNVPVSRIVNSPNVDNIYVIPITLKDIKLDGIVVDRLNLQGRLKPSKDFDRWKQFVKRIESSKDEIHIGITGKYTNVHDSYLSIIKALEHCSPYSNARVKLKWIETTNITRENVGEALKDIHGIIVPGGFGARGAEGKIHCIEHVRKNNIPYLGLCYGFQMALVEFARNVCGMDDVSSTEIRQCKNPVIDLLPEQKKINSMGGTMRLGGHVVDVKKGTMAYNLYKKTNIRMRFRHRYECNPEYISKLEQKGLVFSGQAPDKPIMQICELPQHPFFFGVQFHPEYTSKPLDPDPLYTEFVRAALMYKKNSE